MQLNVVDDKKSKTSAISKKANGIFSQPDLHFSWNKEILLPMEPCFGRSKDKKVARVGKLAIIKLKIYDNWVRTWNQYWIIVVECNNGFIQLGVMTKLI